MGCIFVEADFTQKGSHGKHVAETGWNASECHENLAARACVADTHLSSCITQINGGPLPYESITTLADLTKEMLIARHGKVCLCKKSWLRSRAAGLDCEWERVG